MFQNTTNSQHRCTMTHFCVQNVLVCVRGLNKPIIWEPKSSPTSPNELINFTIELETSASLSLQNFLNIKTCVQAWKKSSARLFRFKPWEIWARVLLDLWDWALAHPIKMCPWDRKHSQSRTKRLHVKNKNPKNFLLKYFCNCRTWVEKVLPDKVAATNKKVGIRYMALLFFCFALLNEGMNDEASRIIRASPHFRKPP